MFAAGIGLCSRTTQAQRPGARDASIATATLPPWPPAKASLQRLVGPPDHAGHRFAPVSSTFTAIQSPRKPNGLSHGIFECLIVEASSRAQNQLSVLADRYTKRCRGVFDCTGDG